MRTGAPEAGNSEAAHAGPRALPPFLGPRLVAPGRRSRGRRAELLRALSAASPPWPPGAPSLSPARAALPARAPALPASSTEANRAGSLRQEFIVCAAPAGRGSPGERSGRRARPSLEGAWDPTPGTHILDT